MEALLTVQEVAAILRVGKWTIERWSREGFIPCAKVGKAYRYRQADIIAWFEGKRDAVDKTMPEHLADARTVGQSDKTTIA